MEISGVSYSGCFTLGKFALSSHQINDWVDHRAGLDTEENRKTSLASGN
jgi:hypothetical protein